MGNEIFREFEEKSIWFQHRNKCILELVKAYPPAGTIFDIGGGNGFVSRSLLNAGLDVALVEPGRAGVRNAIERGVPIVICSTLEDAGFKDNVLPSVGLFDTLEHIKDDVAFLKTIRKLLLPGGRLYLTTPAHQMLWSADDVFAGHYRRYSTASLSATLREAGFSVLFSTYIFSFLPVPIFLVRTVSSKLGLRSSDRIDKVDQERHHVFPGKLGSRVLNPDSGMGVGQTEEEIEDPYWHQLPGGRAGVTNGISLSLLDFMQMIIGSLRTKPVLLKYGPTVILGLLILATSSAQRCLDSAGCCY